MSIRGRAGGGGRYCIDDEAVLMRMREILTAEPCRGLPSEPSQLLSHVYIGSQSNAESLKLLRKLGVTHVLNCAGYKGPRLKPDMSPYEGLDIDYHEFQAEDRDDYDISRHFSEAFRFLDTVKKKKGVALVHCYLGINRSSATCVAYMMVANNWTLLQAVQLLKRKRRICLSNKGFQRQLLRFARMKNLLDQDVTIDRSPSCFLDSERDNFRWAKPPKGRSYSETVSSRPSTRNRIDVSSDSPKLYSVGSDPSFSTRMHYRQDPQTTIGEFGRERIGSLPSVNDASLTYRVYMTGSGAGISTRTRSPSPLGRSITAGRHSSRDRPSDRFCRGMYSSYS